MSNQTPPEPTSVELASSLDESSSVALLPIRRSLLSRVVLVLLGMGAFLIFVAILEFVIVRQLATATVSGGAGLLLLAGGFVGALQVEKRAEEERKNDVKRFLVQTPSTEYFEKLVNINVENLSAYYITVKSHANKSFLASLFVSVVGFVFIGVGIELAITDPQHGPSVAKLSGVSGIATEFISAIFFYLYSLTVRQMKEYHDSLLAVQNILLSFKLVGDTNDPEHKAKMIEVMLEYLVGKRSAPVETGKAGSRHQSKREAGEAEVKAPS